MATKKEISYKAIGQNVIIVLDEQKYSKKIVEKTEREEIKQLVISYNSKNSKTLENKILLIFIKKQEELKKKKVKSEKILKKLEDIKEKTINNTEVLSLSDLEEKEFLSDEEYNRVSSLLDKHKKDKIEEKKLEETKSTIKKHGEY